MDEKTIKKIVREAVGNGFMSEVKLAIIEALKPLIDNINNHSERIKSLEVQGGKCANHETMVEKINKASFNAWVVHVQWFAITVLVGCLAYTLR